MAQFRLIETDDKWDEAEGKRTYRETVIWEGEAKCLQLGTCIYDGIKQPLFLFQRHDGGIEVVYDKQPNVQVRLEGKKGDRTAWCEPREVTE